MTRRGIEIEGTLDGQTDLLDRQITTSDGRALAKTDDIELEVDEANGRIVVTALLVGPGALGPRLGGAFARMTVHPPRRIDYTRVAGIATVITIDEPRAAVRIDGMEQWTRRHVIEALLGSGLPATPEPPAARLDEGPDARGPRHRLSELTGMAVCFADGRRGDCVTDVRMLQGPSRGHLPSLVVDGLVVGKGRPGTLFGYDRELQQGPWIIQVILRRVHRNSGYVAWSDVRDVDWDAGVVTLRTDRLRSLHDL